MLTQQAFAFVAGGLQHPFRVLLVPITNLGNQPGVVLSCEQEAERDDVYGGPGFGILRVALCDRDIGVNRELLLPIVDYRNRDLVGADTAHSQDVAHLALESLRARVGSLRQLVEAAVVR